MIMIKPYFKASIRTNDPTDDFLKSLVPDAKEDEDVVRRGDPENAPQEPDPFEDPFYDPFDDAVKVRLLIFHVSCQKIF